MNEPRRLALVTRRFWPLVGGAETVMGRLAAGLAESGCDVTLLTARWERDWPTELDHRGFRVQRLPQPALRFFGTWRYMQALGRWLRGHETQLDLVYVSMLKHDAHAALGALSNSRVPVVLRAEGSGLTGDVHWQLEDRFGPRIRRRCQKAAAFVAPSPAILRELVAAGYPRERLHYIANGVRVPTQPVDATRRGAARASLAAADPRLRLVPDARLAVFTGRLHAGKGLVELLDAWRLIANQRPQATLWLVGEGPLHDDLRARIEALGLGEQVVLAGAFDDVADVLASADVYFLPSREEGMSVALLEAMALGLPVIASDIPGNRQIVEHEQQGLLVPLDEPAAWAAVVTRVWDDATLGRGLALSARQRTIEEFSLELMIDEHLALFERLWSARSR